MSPITQAVAAWRDNKLDDTGLMRAIVSYPDWKLPVSEEGAQVAAPPNDPPSVHLTTDTHGKSQLLLWSTPETYANWEQSAGTHSAKHFIHAKGAWIFSLPFGDELDEILIDPATAPGLFYRKLQFPELRGMAHAIHIERDLADLRAAERFSHRAVVRVREFPRFLVAIARTEGAQRLILAPDHENRPFAAVFTADDAARNFRSRAQASLLEREELVWVELPGHRIFQILCGLKINGVVFNCEGPTEPVVFGPTFARGVLDA